MCHFFLKLNPTNIYLGDIIVEPERIRVRRFEPEPDLDPVLPDPAVPGKNRSPSRIIINRYCTRIFIRVLFIKLRLWIRFLLGSNLRTRIRSGSTFTFTSTYQTSPTSHIPATSPMEKPRNLSNGKTTQPLQWKKHATSPAQVGSTREQGGLGAARGVAPVSQ